MQNRWKSRQSPYASNVDDFATYDHKGQAVRAAADAVHAQLLGRIAAAVCGGLRSQADIDHLPGDFEGWVLVRGDRVDFVVDDDEDLEGVELHEIEGRHGLGLTFGGIYLCSSGEGESVRMETSLGALLTCYMNTVEERTWRVFVME